jgi:hypothetical protein
MFNDATRPMMNVALDMSRAACGVRGVTASLRLARLQSEGHAHLERCDMAEPGVLRGQRQNYTRARIPRDRGDGVAMIAIGKSLSVMR